MRLQSHILRAGMAALALFWMLPALQADELEDYGAISDSSVKVRRPGSVVWMDLLTVDVKEASQFYGDVFGWIIEVSGDGEYAYATLNGQPVASIAAFEENSAETEGFWLQSIAVPDVKKAVKAVKKSGGAVIEPPEDLPGRGRTALVQDSTGAVFMLLRAEGGDPLREERINGWLWSELWTDDVEAATDFYESVIGYRTVAVKDGSGSTFQVMGLAKMPHATVVKSPLPDVEPNWLAYMLVEDVDATARNILKAGGSILLPPQRDGFNNDVAIVADPTGGVFAIQQKEAE